MHVIRDDVNRFRQDFRDRMLGEIDRLGIPQKEIADACGVHQSTAHRWFSYGGDIDFPAALVRALSTPGLYPLGLAALGYGATGLGVEVRTSRSLRTAARLDGSVVDDTLEITAHIGKLAKLVGEGQLNMVEARRQFEAIRNAANVGLLELDRMDAQRRVAD